MPDKIKTTLSKKDIENIRKGLNNHKKKKKEAALSYFQGKTNYAPDQPEFKQYEDNSKSPAYKKAVKEKERLEKTKNNPLVKSSEKVNKAVINPTLETLELPQKGLTKLATDGKYDNPGDALGLEGGWNTAANIVLDPTNISGAALLRNSIRKKGLGTFKSEIDWGKWNKEIPENKALMEEYHTIEQQAKAVGTWMKNPDGSTFKGTPEQFVQQNSDNFKKAFPNPILDDAGNIQTNYHGSPYKFEEFKPALKPSDKTGERLGSGIYTTPKRTKALEYAIKNQNKKGTLYELYQNANNKQTAIQDIDNYITNKIEKIKSDFLNKKISNQKANELYDAVLKENDELWDKIPDSEFKLQKGKDYLRIDDEQIVPFNNYPKSMIGNNGMFDMTNPNIYKSLFPGAIGAGLMMNNKENSTPQNSFALGGEIDPKKQTRLNYENELMSKVLTERNKDKNWVQRGLNPESYPTLTDKNGNTVTHQLGYTTDNNGNAYVRPNVIQKFEGSGLSWLDDSEANKYAKETNTNMKIPDIGLAEYYSQNGLIKHAMGGNLNKQNNMNNNLNQFNVGGSHEQNIYGGIPVGVDQNGVPNTVEENETMFDDFVFSDRIVLRPDVVSQVGLPKTLANKTVAEATKIIDKQFDGRNTKIDKSTRDAMYDRIAQAQEIIKAEEQAKIAQAQEANSTEVPDMMGGQIPQGMDQFMQPEQGMEQLPMEAQDGRIQSGMQDLGQPMFRYGGKVNKYFLGGLFGTQENPENDPQIKMANMNSTVGGIAGGVGTGMALFDQAKGNTSTNSGEAALSGGLQGATAGTAIMPGIGTAVGAGVGIMSGLIGSNKARKKAEKAAREKEMKDYYDKYIGVLDNNDNTQVFAYGGKVNKYPDGGFPKKLQRGQDTLDFQNWMVKNHGKSTGGQDGIPGTGTYTDYTKYGGMYNIQKFAPGVEVDYTDGDYSHLKPNLSEEDVLKRQISQDKLITDYQDPGYKDGEFDNSLLKSNTQNTPRNNNLGSMLRYAPAAMNAYQLATLKGPQTNRLQRLNNQYQRQFLDEATYQNMAREQAAAARNAIGRSGATPGQMIGAQLGTQLGASKAIADAYNQIRQHNIGENRLRQQTQFSNNQFNIQQDNLEQDINDRNKAAWQNNRSRLLGQLGTDLGNIGKEEIYKDIAVEATGYNWMGKYMQGNPKATKKEVEKEYKKKFPNSTKSDFEKDWKKINIDTSIPSDRLLQQDPLEGNYRLGGILNRKLR